jgi:GTP-binding protein EngB required for normal cell division
MSVGNGLIVDVPAFGFRKFPTKQKSKPFKG